MEIDYKKYNSTDNVNELKQFRGTEHYYKHGISNDIFILLTDGAKHMAEKYGFYWFLDVVFSYQPQLQGEEFQTWHLLRKKGNSFQVTCDDGNNNILITQDIPFSDFELDHARFFFCNGVLMLPREY